jgi:hypothetical protein
MMATPQMDGLGVQVYGLSVARLSFPVAWTISLPYPHLPFWSCSLQRPGWVDFILLDFFLNRFDLIALNTPSLNTINRTLILTPLYCGRDLLLAGRQTSRRLPLGDLTPSSRLVALIFLWN